MSHTKPEELARKYAQDCRIKLIDFLGGGTDGNVWQSNRNTAVKILAREKNYRMELASYQRLRANNVTKIMQLAVPRLVNFDDRYQVVEIEIVSPPRIIDFGKVSLDSQPEHSPETWQYYHDELKDIWGDRYDDVQSVLWHLRQFGIYYADPSRKNIDFGDPPEQ